MSIYTYICIKESLCCIPETNTTSKINYTSIKKKNKDVRHCTVSNSKKLESWTDMIAKLINDTL